MTHTTTIQNTTVTMTMSRGSARGDAVSTGNVKLNGRSVGSLENYGKLGYRANVDRISYPHRPIHNRPSVTERWNYEDEKFTGDTARSDALDWIWTHAIEVATAFPVRVGIYA